MYHDTHISSSIRAWNILDEMEAQSTGSEILWCSVNESSTWSTSTVRERYYKGTWGAKAGRNIDLNVTKFGTCKIPGISGSQRLQHVLIGCGMSQICAYIARIWVPSKQRDVVTIQPRQRLDQRTNSKPWAHSYSVPKIYRCMHQLSNLHDTVQE